MSLPETYKIVRNDSKGEPEIAEKPLPKPSTNQVLVKIEFSPINPTDVLKMKGFYNNGVIPQGELAYNNGTESSGIVVAVGNDLIVPHKVGDRVHVAGGAFAQYSLTSSEFVSPILQDNLSFEDAASHFVNPATVYHMGEVAEKGGHKAAIQTAASSNLGRMLIKYFKHKGIKLINVVRREEYVEELKKEGADYVLNSTSPDFEVKLKELAEKEGVSLAFDAISGSSPSKILKALPPKSTCYIYGVLESTEVTGLHVSELMQGKTLSYLLVLEYVEELIKNGGLQEYMNKVHILLPTVFKTRVHKIFKLEDIKEAFSYYEKNSSKGKILLQAN